MDALDVATLRWLMTGLDRYPARYDIRESMASASKKLHTTETTLRSRVKRLFKSGLLKEWRVFVNPHVAGLRVALLRLDVLPPSAKEDVVRKFKLIENVWLILNNQNNTLGISFYYGDDDSLKKKVELMERIANSENAICGEVPFPPCSYSFGKVDLEIIRAVQELPSDTYSAISKRTHFSNKTVRRRLNRMMAERAIFATVEFDLSKARGILLANLLIEHLNETTAGNTEQRVLDHFDKQIFSAVMGNPKLSNFSLILDNIADVGKTLNAVKEMEGVKDAYVDLAQEYIGVFGPFRRQVEGLMEMQNKEPIARQSHAQTKVLSAM